MVNILTWGAGIFERPKEKKKKRNDICVMNYQVL